MLTLQERKDGGLGLLHEFESRQSVNSNFTSVVDTGTGKVTEVELTIRKGSDELFRSRIDVNKGEIGLSFAMGTLVGSDLRFSGKLAGDGRQGGVASGLNVAGQTAAPVAIKDLSNPGNLDDMIRFEDGGPARIGLAGGGEATLKLIVEHIGLARADLSKASLAVVETPGGGGDLNPDLPPDLFDVWFDAAVCILGCLSMTIIAMAGAPGPGGPWVAAAKVAIIGLGYLLCIFTCSLKWGWEVGRRI